MKNKSFLALLFLVSFTILASDIAAQTITVTPVKTTYRRPKPASSWKKSFTVTRPKVKGTTPVLAKKIETAISYEKSFDFSVQEEIKDIQWLESADYTVDYNKKGVLAVSLTVEGSGAYPDSSTHSVVVNVKTGMRVMPADVFTNLAGLAAKVKAMQKAEIKEGIAEIKKEEPDEENPSSLFESADFKMENLTEFSVSDAGMDFWYDYGFPHVIQAMEPAGRYMITWKELKPYIKPAGLFGQFVK
jgi:hypothetical protein